MDGRSAEVLEWEVDLGATMPKKRIPVVIVALFALSYGALVIHPVIGLIGFLAVIFSTAELFLPLKYRLDETEARVKCGLSVTAIRWENVKRLIDMPDGIRLSPLATAGRLDAFRGVYVRFGSERERILAKIAELAKNVRPMDRGTDAGGGRQLD